MLVDEPADGMAQAPRLGALLRQPLEFVVWFLLGSRIARRVVTPSWDDTTEQAGAAGGRQPPGTSSG
jgi:hypothetical protein